MSLSTVIYSKGLGDYEFKSETRAQYVSKALEIFTFHLSVVSSKSSRHWKC